MRFKDKFKRLNESKLKFYGCDPEIGDVLYVSESIKSQEMGGAETWIKEGSILYVTDVYTMNQTSDIDDTIIVEFDPKRSIIIKGSKILKEKTFQMGQFYEDPQKGIPSSEEYGKTEVFIKKSDVGNK